MPILNNLNISVLDAKISDLPEMVALRVEAAEQDILTRFLYGHRHVEASQKETTSLMMSLGKRFTNPTNRCQIVKAVDTTTDELVGWGLVRWEDGQWVYNNMPPQVNAPDAANFVAFYQRKVRENWQKVLAGKPHVVLGAMNVRVDRQKQGIGSKMMEYFEAEYGIGNEIVIVQTNPVAEEFYRKLGWETVDSTDVDLGEVAKKGLGYGIHRSPQMVRYPRN